MGLFSKIFGSYSEKEVKRVMPIVDKINNLEENISKLSDAELKSKKWLMGGIGLQLFTGYTVAFLVYQIGTLITTGHLGNAFVHGAVAIGIMIAIIVAITLKTNKN